MLSIWEHENKMLKYISPSMELPASKINPRLTLVSSNILVPFLLLLQLPQSRKISETGFYPRKFVCVAVSNSFLEPPKRKKVKITAHHESKRLLFTQFC